MDTHQNSLQNPKEQGTKAFVVELPDQLLWTLKEAAAMCGISTALYAKLRNAGVLPGPISGTNRYSAYSVRQALAENPKSAEDPNSAYDDWKKTHD